MSCIQLNTNLRYSQITIYVVNKLFSFLDWLRLAAYMNPKNVKKILGPNGKAVGAWFAALQRYETEIKKKNDLASLRIVDRGNEYGKAFSWLQRLRNPEHQRSTGRKSTCTVIKLKLLFYKPTSDSNRDAKSLKTALFLSFRSSFQSSRILILKACTAIQVRYQIKIMYVLLLRL